MKIRINDYILEQEVAGIAQWNIYRVIYIKESKVFANIGKEVINNLAYAVSLPRAVEIISTDTTIGIDEIKTLKEYVEDYNKIVAVITDQLVKHL